MEESRNGLIPVTPGIRCSRNKETKTIEQGRGMGIRVQDFWGTTTLSLAVVMGGSTKQGNCEQCRGACGFQAVSVGWTVTQVLIFVDMPCLLGFGQEGE